MARAEPKVVLITGATSGIGRACAEELSRRGHRVIGAGRTLREASPAWRFLPMDVTDDRSVQDGVGQVVSEAGRLDVLINNAGFGVAGAVEETSVEEARRQFETNLFGVLRTCRAALPHFRRQGRGLVVNVSSIGGLIGLPFEGLYSASKFALEGLSEALALEVRPFGVRVALVEPGDIRTGFTAARIWTAESREDSPYRQSRTTFREGIERDESNAPAPEEVARLIGKIVEARSPAFRYTAGPPLQRFAAVLKRLLPDGVFAAILRRAYRL